MSRSAPNQATETTQTPWSLRIAASALNRLAASEVHWHYKEGLLFKGVFHLAEQTGEEAYWRAVQDYLDRFVQPDGSIRSYRVDEFNIDQINPGKLLFPIYRRTRDERYRKAIYLLREQLRAHPRTQGGGFWHKQIYPYQMWLDGIYMGSPFYAEFGATFDEPVIFDDVAHQVITIEQHTRDPRTGLLYHAWDERREQRWSNPETGCSPHFWSRAIGWYLMAIVDLLEIFPAAHTARPVFIDILNRTIDAVAAVQDPSTGLWWQVLDQRDRPGNYFEASGTSMFIYAIRKGLRHGYLPRARQLIADRAFQGLLLHMITIGDEGQVDLHGVCSTAGLGGNPYRDGSFEYYIGEPIITNDLHGVGALLLAAIEMELAPRG